MLKWFRRLQRFPLKPAAGYMDFYFLILIGYLFVSYIFYIKNFNMIKIKLNLLKTIQFAEYSIVFHDVIFRDQNASLPCLHSRTIWSNTFHWLIFVESGFQIWIWLIETIIGTRWNKHEANGLLNYFTPKWRKGLYFFLFFFWTSGTVKLVKIEMMPWMSETNL